MPVSWIIPVSVKSQCSKQICCSPPTTFVHPTWYPCHMVVLSFLEAIHFQLSEHNQSPLLPPVCERFSDFTEISGPLNPCPRFHCLLSQPSSPSTLFHLLSTPPNSTSCTSATAALPWIYSATCLFSPQGSILHADIPTALWPLTAVRPSGLMSCKLRSLSWSPHMLSPASPLLMTYVPPNPLLRNAHPVHRGSWSDARPP